MSTKTRVKSFSTDVPREINAVLAAVLTTVWKDEKIVTITNVPRTDNVKGGTWKAEVQDDGS